MKNISFVSFIIIFALISKVQAVKVDNFLQSNSKEYIICNYKCSECFGRESN